MTDTLAKTSFAWAVVDKDGELYWRIHDGDRATIFSDKKHAENETLWFDTIYAARAPHRTARVKIEEVKEADK